MLNAFNVNSINERISIGTQCSELKWILDMARQDKDTDNSDADDVWGRTAHQLFAGQAGSEERSQWYSSSQLIDDPSRDVQFSSASLKCAIRAIPLTPTSSPVRIGTGTRDNS